MENQEAETILSGIAAGKVKKEESNENTSQNIGKVLQTVFHRVKKGFSGKLSSSKKENQQKQQEIETTEKRRASQIDIEKSHKAKQKGKGLGKGGFSFQKSSQKEKKRTQKKAWKLPKQLPADGIHLSDERNAMDFIGKNGGGHQKKTEESCHKVADALSQ